MRCDSVRTSEGTVLRLDSVGRWLGRSYLDLRASLSRYSGSRFRTEKDRSTFVWTGRRVVVEEEVHVDVGRRSVDERRRGPERPHRASPATTCHYRYAHNGTALACAVSDSSTHGQPVACLLPDYMRFNVERITHNISAVLRVELSELKNAYNDEVDDTELEMMMVRDQVMRALSPAN